LNQVTNDLLKITICDDSSVARKQLSNAISHWEADVFFATNGLEAIEAIKQGRAQLLFLDLNMPVSDGYCVLEAIKKEQLVTKVIVVSGDVQEGARKRIFDLGALAFIKKPMKTNDFEKIIKSSGLPDIFPSALAPTKTSISNQLAFNIPPEERLQEIANIATGKTAAKLADLFDNFINISIPKVNIISNSDLYMMIKGSDNDDLTANISQGFVGSGIRGESVLIIDRASLPCIAKILGFSVKYNPKLELDILFDLASLLGGSFMKAFFDQLNIKHINQSIPATLEFDDQFEYLTLSPTMKNSLAIEISYHLPDHNIQCDLLLLFTLNSIESMNKRTEHYS
jgi:CheY-like chemotaxis protein